MIIFNYHDRLGQVSVEVRCHAEHLEAIIADFRTFLLHVGHHPNNIERITFEERQQGFPQQLDLPL